ncbi:SRPBCC family protein [Dermatophilaceae bacterium Sec6.4]|nr:SRPBCC family protein [Actinomycetota bacterium]
MPQVRMTRETRADVDAVWAVTTDWKRHAGYFPLTQMKVPDEPEGVGRHFEGFSKLGPLTLPDPMVVTAWSPPSPVEGHDSGSFAIRKLGKVLSGTVNFEVHPTPGGATLVWTTDVGPAPRLLATISRPVGGLITKAMYAGVLKKIVAAAEAH